VQQGKVTVFPVRNDAGVDEYHSLGRGPVHVVQGHAGGEYTSLPNLYQRKAFPWITHFLKEIVTKVRSIRNFLDLKV